MNKRIGTYLFFLFLTGCCSLLFGAHRSVMSYTFSGEGLHLQRVKMIRSGGEKMYEISQNALAPGSQVTDLYLSFNSSRLGGLDDSGTHRVRYAQFSPYSGADCIGKGAARFFRQDDYVVLQSQPSGWSTESDDLGSFTIEFRIKPAVLTEGALIFSRTGYTGGEKNGIEITLQKGRVHAAMHNLFSGSRGRRISHEFSLPGELRVDKWYYCALSFSRTDGLLKGYLDSHEVYSRYMTDSGGENGSILIPGFGSGDVPDIIIGRDFTGILDEFRITYMDYEDLSVVAAVSNEKYVDVKSNGRTPANSEGVITSAIYEFPYSGTMIRKFSWKEEIPENTFIWFEIRISDPRFGQFHSDPGWFRVENNQMNIYLHRKKEDGLYLRGRYFQWRAHLIASPDGSRTPFLGDVTMDFELDVPPVPPLGVEIVETGDKYVVLQWKKNVDYDIGGYNVYYGINKGSYDGKIEFSSGKKITNGNGDTIRLRIDNSLIEENRGRDRSNIMTYPLLKNNVLYFFAVSAYDTYRMDSQYNHESDFSREVSGRPFAGSEINGEME